MSKENESDEGADKNISITLGKAGDNAESELFLRNLSESRHRLYAFIYTLSPNHTDAEDIFQETSFVLWNKAEFYDQDRSFFSWACGIAFNVARNHLRTKRRDRLIFSESLMATITSELPARLSADKENSINRMATLESCIKKLTSRNQELVQQVYSNGIGIEEIANTLNRATQTVYNRLSIIRRELTDCVRLASDMNSDSGVK